uniref:Uncharacterized protein n=1 Tax=Glossina pallidipes TaxID=7398 RepID=A0A1B0ABG3_GLOPL
MNGVTDDIWYAILTLITCKGQKTNTCGSDGKDPLLTAHSAMEVFFRLFGRPFRGSPLHMGAQMGGNDYRRLINVNLFNHADDLLLSFLRKQQQQPQNEFMTSLMTVRKQGTDTECSDTTTIGQNDKWFTT